MCQHLRSFLLRRKRKRKSLFNPPPAMIRPFLEMLSTIWNPPLSWPILLLTQATLISRLHLDIYFLFFKAALFPLFSSKHLLLLFSLYCCSFPSLAVSESFHAEQLKLDQSINKTLAAITIVSHWLLLFHQSRQSPTLFITPLHYFLHLCLWQP